jgi:hypothetical protein
MAKRRTAVFNAEPPTTESDIADLFLNRVVELDLAVDRLRDEVTKRVYSVQGARRSGKSHFAHRLVQRAIGEEKLPFTPVIVNAHNRGTARGVLREVYFHFERLLDGLKLTKPDDAKVRDDFMALHRLVNLDKVEWSSEALAKVAVGLEQSQGATLGVPNAAALAASAKGSAQFEEAGRRVERFVGISDRDIVRALERAADLLYTRANHRSVLLLLDDLDLVDSEGREGSTASNELLELLRPLAEHPHITVIATVRNDYGDGRKNVFSRLAELGALEEETLRDVYEKRLEVFYEGEAIFDRDALRLLVDSADGMVGIFLRNCNSVWERQGRSPKLPLSNDAIDEYAAWQLRAWRGEPDTAAVVVAIEEALRKPMPTAEIKLDGDLHRTALHLMLVRPVNARPGVWAINPLFLGAIRSKP